MAPRAAIPMKAAGNDTHALRDAATLVDALRQRMKARLVETHISWVLLDGTHGWKIKKPIRLAFLDARRRRTRRRLCEQELRLNRRLAPALYVDVVTIRGTPAAPRLRGSGPAIEHAVRMRQFASDALFVDKLAAGTLTATHIDMLATRLAAFHASVPAAAIDSPHGEPALIEAQAMRVVDGLLECRPGDRRCIELRAWLAAQARQLHAAWRARKTSGRVREGHGDLHAANLVVLDDPQGAAPPDVTAFDCIEFDAALRWIDVLRDIAFAVMDIAAHGRPDLAWRLLNAWLDATGDHAGVAILRFALVERALVRALVAELRGPHAASTAAPDYLAWAARAASRHDPRLMITHGLSGSGKSHVAQQLLEAVGAIRIRSDVERKRLHGLAALDAGSTVPGGIYGAEATRRTYGRLRELADLALQAGHPVIVDAAFLRGDERADFRALAAAHGVPFTILDCRAPLAVLCERVGARRARGGDPSEADERVVQAQWQFRQPLEEHEHAESIFVDAGTATCIDAIAQRWQAASPPC